MEAHASVAVAIITNVTLVPAQNSQHATQEFDNQTKLIKKQFGWRLMVITHNLAAKVRRRHDKIFPAGVTKRKTFPVYCKTVSVLQPDCGKTQATKFQ